VTPGSSRWPLFLLSALALSIGWGIRGNFGHEFGALLPGALAALTAVLLSGREDWLRRIHWFGFLGALGWSFGGSISYMQVIAYTHSGHSGTIAYGFACLFVIGFLWAAMGGAGTALPMVLNRQKLAELLPAILVVFVAWVLQTVVEIRLEGDSQFRHQDPLYWYDTDWLAAATALVAVLLLAAVRRRWDAGCSLVTFMAVGWWLGVLILVNLLGLRMTPPRGDSWSGCVGMTIGLWVWLWRQGLLPALFASVVTGFVGGLGFATAALLQTIELKSGAQTNYHSILEQTYGFINGLGIALAVWWLRDRVPPLPEEGAERHWPGAFAVAFVLVAIPWLNLKKNPGEWTRLKLVPEAMAGLPTTVWFHLAFGLLALAVLVLLWQHARRPLELLPGSWQGRGQLLLLALLWVMVAGNFARALGSFQAQRLVTEGVIQLNAVLLTLGVLLAVTPVRTAALVTTAWSGLLRRVTMIGLVVFAVSVLLDWGTVRLLYGDQPAGFHKLHIRFGPNATATKEKPKFGQPHP
jgi:hypothetical protein